jgi:rhodanese-related sulfurtransferase
MVVLMSLPCLAQKEVQRVDKDSLKSWLGQPDVLIIDVRAPRDWSRSDNKIKGAVRRDPGKVAVWGKTLPKDKKIVLYCA